MQASKFIKGVAIAGGALLAAKGLDNRLETTHYTISSDKIPAEFDGFRIVQLSDLHSSVVPGLADEVKGEKPDIIVYTGDMVHDHGSYDTTIRLTERLSEFAPIFSVSGNHDLRRSDYSEYLAALDATGTITLKDSSKTLRCGNGKITLTGIEDPFSEDGNTINHNIAQSLKKITPTDNFHIALFHRANHMNSLQNGGFDLILSGHMHGGQFRLPNGRGVCSPKSSWGSGSPMFFPKYFAGHYKNKKTDMIVSRGIGNPMIIPRLFNRPEITVIILQSTKTKEV